MSYHRKLTLARKTRRFGLLARVAPRFLHGRVLRPLFARTRNLPEVPQSPLVDSNRCRALSPATLSQSGQNHLRTVLSYCNFTDMVHCKKRMYIWKSGGGNQALWMWTMILPHLYGV